MTTGIRPLQGHVGAPVTPFLEDESLDTQTLQKLVQFYLDQGVDCLALLMHLGENLKLTSAEIHRFVEVSLEVIQGRVPTYVHVSSGGTRRSVELAQFAESAGADGVIVMPPYHWRASDRATYEHIKGVADAIDVGVVAYNNPNATGARISFSSIEQLLATSRNFVGLKDAGFDIRYFTELCRIAAETKATFNPMSGVEFVLPTASVGGKGTFSLAGAVAPHTVKRLVDLSLEHRFEEALPLQRTLSSLCVLLEDPGYPRKIKAAMRIMGRDCGPLRQPREPLSDDEHREIEERLDALGLLDSEPRGW